MDLKTIQTNAPWATGAGDINENFSRTNTEIEKLKVTIVNFKGYFTDIISLTAAVPSPKPGDYAWVGSPYPGVINKCVTGEVWQSTPEVPQTPNVDMNNWAKTNW